MVESPSKHKSTHLLMFLIDSHGFTVLVGSRNLERGGIKGNAVSPVFTKTNLNNYEGTETVEEGAREAVRVAMLGQDGPTGTFTHSPLGTLPW